MKGYLKRVFDILIAIVTVVLVTFISVSTCYASSGTSGDNRISIKCIGDSVTEGMLLEDHHAAVLGGSTYPSILYTILNENGVNAVVENAGHGGETTGAIVSRLGGVKMYLSEDVIFDSEGCTGSINNKIIADYSPQLQVPITFTYTLTDINPVIIEGHSYEARIKVVDGQRLFFLCKASDDPTTIIRAGSSVELSGKKNSNVNIIFAGINDSKSVTIDQYVEMLKKGASANGNRYIILGPHSKIYDRQGFVEGATSEERRQNYRSRMISEFGAHFIDLNTEWCERALPIAQNRGFFDDFPDEHVNSIQTKLSNRIIPAEFTVTNKDNSVHLNKAGYAVIAQIVYERLKLLKYI